MNGKKSSRNVRPTVLIGPPKRPTHAATQVGLSNVLHLGCGHKGLAAREAADEEGLWMEKNLLEM